jgi:hypothetical protein
VVKRLSTLTRRMDSLNTSLSTFWAADPATPSPSRRLPGVRIVYAEPDALKDALAERDLGARPPPGTNRTRVSSLLRTNRTHISLPHPPEQRAWRSGG